MIVMRHDLVRLLDRYIRVRRTASTQKIDQLVAGDGVDPWHQRLARIICAPLEVDSQHRFLNQIFRLRRSLANSRQLALVVGTQSATQSTEEHPVSSRIALLACKHQGLQFDFVGRHACVYLTVRRRSPSGYSDWHPASKNQRDRRLPCCTAYACLIPRHCGLTFRHAAATLPGCMPASDIPLIPPPSSLTPVEPGC